MADFRAAVQFMVSVDEATRQMRIALERITRLMEKFVEGQDYAVYSRRRDRALRRSQQNNQRRRKHGKQC